MNEQVTIRQTNTQKNKLLNRTRIVKAKVRSY